MLKDKTKKSLAFLLCSVITMQPGISAIAADMPSGAVIQSGKVKIAKINPNHLQIDQTSTKSVINWDSFSVHKGGRVDFNMPSSNSSSLNRVLGSTPSSIAGQVNSNGQVILVNPNGVFLTKTSTVNSSSFIASSLNIQTSDFLNDSYTFSGSKKSRGVENHGRINVKNYGNVSLLGGYASNTGVINARLGKIFIGGGEKITLDLVGTGLMNIVVPTSHLENVKDINGNSLSSLVTNEGSLNANGGVVQLSGKTAENLMLGSVNIGINGVVSATTVDQTTGNIIIGGDKNNFVSIEGKVDLSSSTPSTPSGNLDITGTNVYYGGTTNASGSIGGKISVRTKEVLVLDSSIIAKGLQENGGDLMIVSEDVLLSTTRTNVDMSGSINGGSIKLHADNHNLAAGTFQSDGDLGKGGYIDFAGQNVRLAAADISARGSSQGGKVRIGGEYLGGQKLSAVSQKEYDGFINRFDNQNDIINAKKTIVDYDVNINISSQFGQGGAAVVWSDETTDFMGSIDANGYLSVDNNWITKVSNNKKKGGFVEISSKDLLRTVLLDRVSVNYGTLLLDPKNITVDASGSSGGSLDNGLRAQVYYNYFNDSFSYFGSVGGRTQDSRSSVRNRFNRDFTTINHITPGRNFAERYSAEWRGFFKPKQTGTHRFYTYSDDSSWAWLFTQGWNNVDSWSDFISVRNTSNRLVDNRGAHGMRIRYSSNVTLQADTYYPLLIYFGERTGGDRIDFGWQGPGQGWTTNISGVAYHNNNEFSTGSFAGATGSAGIETVNSFSTDTSSTNTVGSGTIQDLLRAGTDVYLRANQDITVSNAINVTGNSGGNLSLLAGRDITINSDITTANGDLTLRANTSTSYGVIDSQRGSGTADITNNATINAGSGTVTAVIDGGAGLSNDQPGNISLGTITAGAINATGDSATGTITGTSLTASNNSGTTVNISGYEIGTISTINTVSNNTNWRITRLNSSTDSSFSNLPSADFIQYGYSSGNSVSGSGDGIMTGYDPGVLTKTYSGISGTSKKVTKVYDGTTSTSSATFGNATVTSANGLSSNLSVTLSDQTYIYSSKEAGDNKLVTADSAYSISSASHSRHGDVYGLEASSTVKQINNAQVTAKPVSLSGTRQYDGTTSVDSSDLTVSNFVGSETVTLSGSGSLSSADVQSSSSLSSTSGLSLEDGSGGGLASNYTLTGGSQSVSVTKRPVVMSGSREYDGTNTISASDVSFVGTVGSDDLSVSGKMTVSNGDIGFNKSVSMRSTKLQDGSNGKASNYELVSGTFSIAKKQITAKLSKVYDGSKEVLNTALDSFTGLVGKEKLALSGSASISDANAGSTKAIASNDLGLSDSNEKGAIGKASNYELKTVVIDVAKRNLEIVGEKIYDSSVAIKESIFTKISGLVANEDINVSSTASLSNSDAGNHTISSENLALSNGKSGLASNYSINSAMVTVKKKPVRISGSGKFNRSSNRKVVIDKRALRLQNVEKNDKIDVAGIALISGIAEGARDLIVSKLSLVGDKAKNYTLLGESHKFLVKLNERFKAKTEITNKLNDLQRSGKKVITGATQAMPKIAALAPPSAPNVSVSTPSPSGGAPSASPSTAASPAPTTGGSSSQTGSSSGGSTESSSSSGGETGGNESSSDESN